MTLIVLLVLLVILLYVKVVKPYDYWTSRGVKQHKQVYVFGDNASVMFRKESFFDMVINLYNAFPEERYMGMYQTTLPTLILRDPELIKQIGVKEFDHFLDHRSFVPKDVDRIWSKNLFALQECADEYLKYFNKTDDTKTVELKDTFTRYTNDVIATVAFGIKCDSINKKNNEFYYFVFIIITVFITIKNYSSI